MSDIFLRVVERSAAVAQTRAIAMTMKNVMVEKATMVNAVTALFFFAIMFAIWLKLDLSDKTFYRDATLASFFVAKLCAKALVKVGVIPARVPSNQHENAN
jgi:hypothetical protein